MNPNMYRLSAAKRNNREIYITDVRYQLVTRLFIRYNIFLLIPPSGDGREFQSNDEI